MASMIAWALGIGVSAAVLAFTAGFKLDNPAMAYLHMAMVAAIVAAFALMAIRDVREATAHGAKADRIASIGVRYLALVWAWGAATLFITYGLVLPWHEWWHFVLACAVLAGLCLLLATALSPNSEVAGEDAMLRLARILMRVHLGAMVITIVGLLVDGKMIRFLTPRHHDWAAQNVFFFGAIAMAAISWKALTSLKASAAPAVPQQR